ncbi:MAG: signal recognition particle-docking protein FtsY [Ilumatobacter coccineus]|uniref:Signal recognition particle receptor FtsY n=1 Tax=Ilumatobacter coccineus TaxID=467094 RepID=A0A2G6KAT2_9ACTN|nr:MAG: signal recognition particle-docking protein FtsY [Ilumatobacter coccineus]
MEWYWVIPVIVAVVIMAGVGLWWRTRAGAVSAPPRPSELAVPDTPVVAADEDEVVDEPAPPASLRDRLGRARSAFSQAIGKVLGRSAITPETWDDLEEALLRADVGLAVSDELLDGLKERVSAGELTEPGELVEALRADMTSRLGGTDRSLNYDKTLDGPNVWLFVGVNGVGKTTSIGKVARHQRDAGHSVLLAAGDTFRAAAAEQLHTWAERSDTDFVRGSDGADPSSVIFDGVERAAARQIDLVLADTAGRLHNKTNLMEELRKVRRVAEKGAGTVTETLLVIDATTGQNGMAQARQFHEVTEVTGVILTKLDGSAKGGIVFAIETELGLPIKLVGIGESVEDLIPFDPDEFVAALVDR